METRSSVVVWRKTNYHLMWRSNTLPIITSMRLLHWLFLVTIVTSAGGGRARVRLNSQSTSRSIQLLNQSGLRIDFYWINSATGELAASNTPNAEGVAVGGDSAVNSYVGHSFEVHELPSKKTNRCKGETCKTTRFTVSQNEDQIFTLHKNFTVTVEDHKTRAQDKAKTALTACQVADASSSNGSNSRSPEEQIDAMIECMERQIDETLSETQQEIQFQASIRKDMGHALTEYICNDVNATTSKEVVNHTFTYTDPNGTKEEKNVRILFEAEFSKILLVEDFISSNECQAIHQGSKPINDNDDDIESLSDDDEDVMVLPLSAKTESVDVVKVLLKVQSLINTMLGRKVTFGDKDPLLEIHRYHSVKNDEIVVEETCTNNEEEAEKGSCTAATNTGAAAVMKNRNIHWIQHHDDNEEEEVQEEEQVEVIFATIMIICQANRGVIHFPKTGVHVTATNETVGQAVLVVHRDAISLEQDEDPYLDVYAICTPALLPSSSDSEKPQQEEGENAGMTLLVDRFVG